MTHEDAPTPSPDETTPPELDHIGPHLPGTQIIRPVYSETYSLATTLKPEEDEGREYRVGSAGPDMGYKVTDHPDVPYLSSRHDVPIYQQVAGGFDAEVRKDYEYKPRVADKVKQDVEDRIKRQPVITRVLGKIATRRQRKAIKELG